MAESIEILEMCNTSPQDERNLIHIMRDPDISLYESKITNQKETAKQKLGDKPDGMASLHNSIKSKEFAAAQLKKPLEEETSKKGSNLHSVNSIASPGQKKQELDINKSNIGKETNLA